MRRIIFCMLISILVVPIVRGAAKQDYSKRNYKDRDGETKWATFP
jgi:hypothetical protein